MYIYIYSIFGIYLFGFSSRNVDLAMRVGGLYHTIILSCFQVLCKIFKQGVFVCMRVNSYRCISIATGIANNIMSIGQCM